MSVKALSTVSSYMPRVVRILNISLNDGIAMHNETKLICARITNETIRQGILMCNWASHRYGKQSHISLQIHSLLQQFIDFDSSYSRALNSGVGQRYILLHQAISNSYENLVTFGTCSEYTAYSVWATTLSRQKVMRKISELASIVGMASVQIQTGMMTSTSESVFYDDNSIGE